MLVEKILVKQFFGQKNLVKKKICSKKIFAQKCQKNLWPKKNLVKKINFWSKNFEAKKKVWSKNIFSQNTKV